MGTGTDVAMSSAQVTLVKGDLRGIVRARELSEATVRNMKQNLGFAFLYNALGVPVAAGVLYPFFGWLMSPIWRARDETVLSIGGRQCVAVEDGPFRLRCISGYRLVQEVRNRSQDLRMVPDPDMSAGKETHEARARDSACGVLCASIRLETIVLQTDAEGTGLDALEFVGP